MRIDKAFLSKATRVAGTLWLVVFASACGINSTLQQTNLELRNAVNTFDSAIDSLVRQSADWQLVLQDLEAAVVDDVQSTVRAELTDLLRNGVLATGSEFRCDTDFLRLRMAGELRRIRNDLATELNGAGLRPPIPLLPVPPPRPVLCSAAPSAVDLGLEPERRTVLNLYGYDLRSLPITAEVAEASGGRTNVSAALGILSDTQMVLDLTAGGANLDTNARQIELSWDGAVQSVIRVIVRGPTAPVCTTRVVIVPGSVQSFVPPHTRGDREYDGNGPCVNFNLSLATDLPREAIKASYSMKAYECPDDFGWLQWDYTIAEGSGEAEIYRVPPGSRIVGFDLAASFFHRYIDNSIKDDLFHFTGTSPAEKLIFVGDTDGSEAGTRTKVDIYFRELRVTLQECH